MKQYLTAALPLLKVNDKRSMVFLRKWFNKFPLEAVIWISGLGAMALHDPIESNHFSLCPFNAVGFHFCPGCGLGRSVSFLFHGEISASFAAHPLGIFAVIVLSFRIVKLMLTYFKTYGQNN